MNDRHGLRPLLEAALRGDETAMTALLEQLRGWVRLEADLLLGQQLGGRADASDIAQEVCLRIHQGFGRFHGQNVAQLLAWVSQIVSNVVDSSRKHHLAQKRDRRRDVSGDKLFAVLAARTAPPEAMARRDEQALCLAGALERLPEHARQVIHDRFFEGLPFSQISARCGKSEGALRVLCVRTLARLRQLMESGS
jgi:RNA polymerase sigma-70 factor (ECF subfamily)